MKRRERMMEDLDRDIREHIEMETQDNIDRGMPPEEARYAAVRKFGNVMRVTEDTREVWSLVWLEQLCDLHSERQQPRPGRRRSRGGAGWIDGAFPAREAAHAPEHQPGRDESSLFLCARHYSG